MADTQRTRAALLTLFADNTAGDISAQDFRDFVVTLMNNEFTYEGDFWTQPSVANMTADGVRGWIQYSQVMDSAMSFGNVVYMTPSGTWKQAKAENSGMNALLALCTDSIAINDSGNLLRKGLIYKSQYSGMFNSNLGGPVYLASDVLGSIQGTASLPTNSVKVIGVIEGEHTGIFRFDPNWAVVGTL